jgi:hypothetical protein
MFHVLCCLVFRFLPSLARSNLVAARAVQRKWKERRCLQHHQTRERISSDEKRQEQQRDLGHPREFFTKRHARASHSSLDCPTPAKDPACTGKLRVRASAAEPFPSCEMPMESI